MNRSGTEANGRSDEPKGSDEPKRSDSSRLQSSATPPLDDLYREVVLDHFKHPRGRGKLNDPTISVEGYNPACGDQVRVLLAVEGDRIKDAQVECQGCSISVASGSMMAELMVGKSEEEIGVLAESFKAMMHGREPDPGLDLGDLEALGGVRKFPVRIKCALLAWTTVQEALAAFRQRDKASESGNGAGDPAGVGEADPRRNVEGENHAEH